VYYNYKLVETKDINQFYYVYRIIDIRYKKHYYGSKFAKGSKLSDVGTIYFTSSTDSKFRYRFKTHPWEFKVKIVSIHKSAKEAHDKEGKLQIKVNVQSNLNFYNIQPAVKNFQCIEPTAGRIWVHKVGNWAEIIFAQKKLYKECLLLIGKST